MVCFLGEVNPFLLLALQIFWIIPLVFLFLYVHYTIGLHTEKKMKYSILTIFSSQCSTYSEIL